MKKFLPILLTFSMVLCFFASCGDDGQSKESQTETTIEKTKNTSKKGEKGTKGNDVNDLKSATLDFKDAEKYLIERYDYTEALAKALDEEDKNKVKDLAEEIEEWNEAAEEAYDYTIDKHQDALNTAYSDYFAIKDANPEAQEILQKFMQEWTNFHNFTDEFYDCNTALYLTNWFIDTIDSIKGTTADEINKTINEVNTKLKASYDNYIDLSDKYLDVGRDILDKYGLYINYSATSIFLEPDKYEYYYQKCIDGNFDF